MHTQLPPFDVHGLRAALGKFVTGVTTIDAARRAHGLTVNSFASVSLDPPLVLWSQSKRAASHASFYDADDVATSILAEEHLDVATGFSKPLPDKFSNIELDRPPWALNAISRRWEAAVQTSWPWSLAALDSEGQVSK